MESLSGQWEADNGGRNIFVVQTGDVAIVNWTEPNPYWNYAAGTIRDHEVNMSFASGDHQRGMFDGNSIHWENGTSWHRV